MIHGIARPLNIFNLGVRRPKVDLPKKIDFRGPKLVTVLFVSGACRPPRRWRARLQLTEQPRTSSTSCAPGVLYMQSVRIIECFICKVSLLLSALYAKCPYY